MIGSFVYTACLFLNWQLSIYWVDTTALQARRSSLWTMALIYDLDWCKCLSFIHRHLFALQYPIIRLQVRTSWKFHRVHQFCFQQIQISKKWQVDQSFLLGLNFFLNLYEGVYKLLQFLCPFFRKSCALPVVLDHLICWSDDVKNQNGRLTVSLIVKEFEENDLNLAKLQTRVYCIVFMPPPPVLCTANGILFSTGPRVCVCMPIRGTLWPACHRLLILTPSV